MTVRTISATIAAVATAGMLSIFVGAAPAFAATDACGVNGTVVEPGICEQAYTSGTATFTPTAGTTQLEVLLVGAGGAGSADGPAAGGGGEVNIVNFSGSTDPLTLTVAASSVVGTVTDGTTTGTVGNGGDGFFNDASLSMSQAIGGTSGSGELGTSANSFMGPAYAGGGGALASPATQEDGGAGVIVSAIAPAGSLFSSDSNCYGGGGAAGVAGVGGVPGCGGGGPTDPTASALTPAAANSGGGGGALWAIQPAEARAGADGLIAIRWNAAPITLNFVMNGHGVAPAPQTFIAGNTAVQPPAPTADGFSFEGWFTDPALTTPVDFSAGVNDAATFYASWAQVLAVTGGSANAAALPIGLATLLSGVALFTTAVRMKRQAN